MLTHKQRYHRLRSLTQRNRTQQLVFRGTSRRCGQSQCRIDTKAQSSLAKASYWMSSLTYVQVKYCCVAAISAHRLLWFCMDSWAVFLIVLRRKVSRLANGFVHLCAAAMAKLCTESCLWQASMTMSNQQDPELASNARRRSVVVLFQKTDKPVHDEV